METQMPAEGPDGESLEYLRAMYGGKKGRGKGMNRKKFSFSSELLCNILLLLSVCLIGILSFFFYVSPMTEISDARYRGKTMTIYGFLYGDENSVIKQLIAFFRGLSEFDAGDIAGALKAVRLVFLAVCTVILAIQIVVRISFAWKYFFTFNSIKLRSSAVKMVAQSFKIYLAFVFFGSVSGGTGADAYFVGYRAGIGMTVGVFLGLAVLLTVSGIGYSKNKRVTIEVRVQWWRSLIAAVGFVGIALVLANMRLYTVVVYVLSTSVSAVVAGAIKGFEFKAIIFPALNLFLFSACIAMAEKSKEGFCRTMATLLNYGDEKYAILSVAKKKRKKRKAEQFFVIILLSFLCNIAVLLLNIPTLGYGWAVDISSPLIWIFAISCIAQSGLMIFSGFQDELYCEEQTRSES